MRRSAASAGSWKAHLRAVRRVKRWAFLKAARMAVGHCHGEETPAINCTCIGCCLARQLVGEAEKR